MPLFRAWTIRDIWPDVQNLPDILNHIGAVCAEQLRVERNFPFFFIVFSLHQFNVPNSAHTTCWPVNKTPHHLIEPRRSLGSLSTQLAYDHKQCARPGSLSRSWTVTFASSLSWIQTLQGSTTAAQPTFHCPCRPWRKAPEADMERLGLITPNEAHFMRPEFQEPAAPHRTP